MTVSTTRFARRWPERARAHRRRRCSTEREQRRRPPAGVGPATRKTLISQFAIFSKSYYPAAPTVTDYGPMLTRPLILRRATADHLGTVIGLIEDAAEWLQTQGTDQWARPWPTRAARDGRILADIHARLTWIGWDNGTAAATIAVDPHPNVAWPDQFRRERAVYIHRLVVSRTYARVGLGCQLLDWAAGKAWRKHRVLW